MAAVAAELHRAGFDVTGSDSGIYPPMSDFLYDQDVRLLEGYKPDNIPSDALIVVGNAISRGNPELEAAMDQACNLISLPDLISRRYLTGKCPVVVAGTHGKTTTTAMIAHILRYAGRDPGWMLGGMPLDLEVPCWMGGGDVFVIEGDEYDSVWFDKRPKFFHYKPRIAVLTSIEYDHSDIYDSIDAIETAFWRFARLLPRNGKLIACGDYPLVRKVASDAFCDVETYGSDGCDWVIKDITKPEQGGGRGEFTGPEGLTGAIELSLMGEHNLKNALVASIVALRIGVHKEIALEALRSFRGVKRRLELLVDVSGIAVWEDFAHHPTAIKTTLSGIRNQYPKRRIWALFEPRSNTMVRNIFADELIEALGQADRVILAPLHRKERIPMAERLNSEAVISQLNKIGVKGLAAQTFDEVVEEVERDVKEDDVIVIMSNGGFGGVKDRIEALIRNI